MDAAVGAHKALQCSGVSRSDFILDENGIPWILETNTIPGMKMCIRDRLKTENTQQKNQTLMMGAIMSLMMLWISWGSPAGVLLFWGASSLIGIGQNQLTLARCRAADRRKEEAEALVVKPIEVNVTRKEQKQRPKKKS